MSEFVFVTCQPGAEKFVKSDVIARDAGYRFAFSRPGYITFKHTKPRGLEVKRPSVFARSWGVSFGWQENIPKALTHGAEQLGQSPDLVHAFVRDDLPIDEAGEAPWLRADELSAEVASSVNWPSNRAAATGEVVLDLVAIDPGRIAIGAHRHDGTHRPTPGGRPLYWQPPTDAPSRVWGKVTEALWRTGQSVGPSDTILDIGCAPGGGTLILLEAGARVIGVDPAQMHPTILAMPPFTHLPTVLEKLVPRDLPKGITGLVYDINLSPRLMLGALARLLSATPSIQWGLVTLKLNQPGLLQELPWMLDTLRNAGFPHLFVEQLFYNRQELFCYATKAPWPHR